MRAFVMITAMVLASLAFTPAAEAGTVIIKSGSPHHHYKHKHHHKHHHHHSHWAQPSWSKTFIFSSTPIVPVAYAYPQPAYAQPIALGGPVISTHGQFCREYQGIILVGGLKTNGYGTACLQPDGSWKIVN